MIKYYIPEIRKEEIQAAIRVLKSGNLACGIMVEKLEGEYSKHCGDQYCIAVSSATAGLYLVCKFRKLYNNWKEIAIPAYTFCATKQAADSAGLKTEIVDIDNDYSAFIYSKPFIDVIFSGSFDGHNTQYECIAPILDCAHCFPVDTNGCVSVYSFYPTKPIGSNGGGMIITCEKDLADWCRKIRQHGRSESVGCTENPVGIGFNFWMSDLNASIAIEQLKKIKYLKESRKEIAERYVEGLKGIDCYYGDHLFMVRLKSESERIQVEMMFKSMQCGYSRPYIPLAPKEQAPNAWNLYERSISIPYYPSLTKNDQRYIIETIKRSVE